MPIPRAIPFPASLPRRRAATAPLRPIGRPRRLARRPARAAPGHRRDGVMRILPLLILAACILAWVSLPGPRGAGTTPGLCLGGGLRLAGPSCGSPQR